MKVKKSTGKRLQQSFRLRRRTVMLSIVFAMLLLLLDNIFAISDDILAVIFPPKVLTDAPASNLFYFQTLISWTVVSVDGHPLAHLPSSSTDSPVELAKGTHQVSWQAEPFQTLTCILTVPVGDGLQTCPMTLLTDPNRFTPSARLVAPPQAFSLRLLPATQRQQLLAITQQFLDTLQSTDIVQPGESYRLTPDAPLVQKATQPLQISQRFLLDTDTSRSASCQGIALSFVGDPSCFIARQDCRLFCTLRWPGDAQPHWDVAVIIRALYTYTSQTAAHQAQTGETQQFVALRIRWEQGTWQVAFHQQGDSFFDDPNCHDMISILTTDPHYHSLAHSHWTYTSGSNRAQGCVAVMQSDDPSQPVPASTGAGTFLFDRFSVLLTASARAAQQWSRLPHASTQEQDLAEEILRHPAFVS